MHHTSKGADLTLNLNLQCNDTVPCSSTSFNILSSLGTALRIIAKDSHIVLWAKAPFCITRFKTILELSASFPLSAVSVIVCMEAMINLFRSRKHQSEGDESGQWDEYSLCWSVDGQYQAKCRQNSRF